MSGVQKINVNEDEDGMRLDRWFRAHFPAIRHGQLEKMLRKGEIRVNGGRVKAASRLVSGAVIRVPPLPDVDPDQRPRPQPTTEYRRSDLVAMMLFEDDHLLALNKPFALAVQGGEKTKRHVDGMVSALYPDAQRPRLVHRLDKDTGGVLLLAKTRKAAQNLADQLQGRAVEKTYWALVAGTPRPREGRIDLAISKKMTARGERVTPAMDNDSADDKYALSDFQTMDEAGALTFLAMRPITGRTHQLRVHAAAIGCPIVGDGKYGGAESRIEGISPNLHLFCRAMRIRHPATQKIMTITAPLTGHMYETWSFLSFDKKALCEWPEEY